jgi:hypothetical protein
MLVIVEPGGPLVATFTPVAGELWLVAVETIS